MAVLSGAQQDKIKGGHSIEAGIKHGHSRHSQPCSLNELCLPYALNPKLALNPRLALNPKLALNPLSGPELLAGTVVIHILVLDETKHTAKYDDVSGLGFSGGWARPLPDAFGRHDRLFVCSSHIRRLTCVRTRARERINQWSYFPSVRGNRVL
jgi:hypothetical protein